MALPLRRARGTCVWSVWSWRRCCSRLGAACAGAGSPVAGATAQRRSRRTASPAPAELIVTPAANAKNDLPGGPGHRPSWPTAPSRRSSLTNPEGKEVKGEFDAEKSTWTHTEPLGYDKTYTLTVVGTGDDGQQARGDPQLHDGQARATSRCPTCGRTSPRCSTAARSASASRSWSGSTSRSRTRPPPSGPSRDHRSAGRRAPGAGSTAARCTGGPRSTGPPARR